MALAWNTGLTLIDQADATTGWSGFRHNGGGTPSPSVDTDVEVQNTGCLAMKVTGINRDEGMFFDFGSGNEVDFTTTANKHFWGWVMATATGLLSTQANGGIFVIAASDANGDDWSKWYVGGSDTHKGAFERIVMDMSKASSEDASTACTMTSVRFIGFGIKSNGTAKQDNFFVDRMDYGQAALQATNDATGNVDIAWQDYFDEDSAKANMYGIIDKRGSIFYLRGGIIIGDAAQSGTVTFDDATGAIVEFEDPTYDAGSGPVTRIDAANLYTIGAQAAGSQATIITFGDVVGTGDDRFGVQGGTIRTAGQSWNLDFATDISDFTTVELYGLTMVGASGGIDLDDGNKTTVVSCTFVNCGELVPGTTNSGSEILNCAFIDPDNYAIEWANTTHNLTNLSLITSGTPTTQNMIHLTQSADYSTSFDGIIFFGSYASSTIRHGENTGTDADVTINAVAGSGSNPAEAEFNNTAGGTITVNNTVTLKVTVKDVAGVVIQDAQTAIFDSGDVELMNEDTLSTGVAEEQFNYVSDENVSVRVRKGSSTDNPKYKPVNSPQVIKDTGLDVTVTLDEDTNNNS